MSYRTGSVRIYGTSSSSNHAEKNDSRDHDLLTIGATIGHPTAVDPLDAVIHHSHTTHIR
jgi:hypothetical protein